MGLGYKTVSIIKELAENIIENKQFCSLISFGYQHITIPYNKLVDLLGKESAHGPAVRYDYYGSKQGQVKAMPLDEFKRIVFAKTIQDKIDFTNNQQLRALFKIKKTEILRGKLKFDFGSVFNMHELKSLGIENIKTLVQHLKHDKLIWETDSLFEKLGIRHTALDLISHTGTEVIHDLNMPIAEHLHNSFNIVLDSGTSEHCFNVPQVLMNAANLCCLGGYVCHIVPMTWPNHGFYNFNPCLFHEFYERNGFKTVFCLAGLHYDNDPFHEVSVSDIFKLPPENALLVYSAKKVKMMASLSYPIQSIYL